MTVVLFDLYGTLADPLRMRAFYATHLGQVMTERFGGQAQAWADAHRHIVEDWDSYYADLDLNGENGLNDLREGEVRTTRALFRLTRIPEPDREALFTLARELPYLVTRRYDTLYTDSKPVLERLHKAGCALGIASNTTTSHSRGALEGGGVLRLFTMPILGPDVTERFTGDREFFLAANVDSRDYWMVAHQTEGIEGAKAAGMRTVQILRDSSQQSSLADHVLDGDLHGLVDILGITSE